MAQVGYFEAFGYMWKGYWTEWKQRDLKTEIFLTDFIDDFFTYSFISTNDILLCLFLGFLFTIVRFFLTRAVFKPIFRKLRLHKKEEEKCPESAFKLLFYSSAYGYCFYLLFIGKYKFFQDTKNCWRGWHKGMPVPDDIYTLYVVQAGYYIHALYAVLYMDVWRKDSVLMIFHHIVTISLIVFSFAVRYHRIGVLILFLHDVNDVFLEFCKLCVAFKTRNGKYHIVPDILSNVGFLCFTFLWFYCRLYIYPIKVLYSCGYEFRPLVPTGPFYFFFNIMLWILFAMNLWWFRIILWLLIRTVAGKTLEDIREKPDKKTMANGKRA